MSRYVRVGQAIPMLVPTLTPQGAAQLAARGQFDPFQAELAAAQRLSDARAAAERYAREGVRQGAPAGSGMTPELDRPPPTTAPVAPQLPPAPSPPLTAEDIRRAAGMPQATAPSNAPVGTPGAQPGEVVAPRSALGMLGEVLLLTSPAWAPMLIAKLWPRG